MTGYWVRDILHVWHKAATRDPDDDGRYFVRCLNTPIDFDMTETPVAGAVICDDCMDVIEREEAN